MTEDKKIPQSREDMIGVRFAADILQAHENTVRNWAAEGRITGHPLRPDGTYLRFSRSEIESLADALNAQKQTAGRIESISWAEVAHRLAARLAHHAYICNEHRAPDPEANCPYCKDTLAYEIYMAKSGTDLRPIIEGESVSVEELRRQLAGNNR